MFEQRNLKKMMSLAKMVEDWDGVAEALLEFFTHGVNKGNFLA